MQACHATGAVAYRTLGQYGGEVVLIVKTSRPIEFVADLVGRLSLLSPVLGETDAPAPVRAREWVRERGRVRVDAAPTKRSGSKPLTLVLSPSRRGEAWQSVSNERSP